MVVFTCNHCGESVHKPKIEKHYQFACRNYKSLTCVDCFKDFRDEEYVSHTKCLTEDERYAAKGAFKNGIVKKGDAKQDSWLDMIRSICSSEENLKPSLRNLLNTISEYSNVPRKKLKFMNFIKSSSGNRANITDVEEVWDIIEKYKSKNIQTNETKAPNLPENNIKEKNENQKLIETPQKRSNENDGIQENPKKKKKSSKVSSQDGLESTMVENNTSVREDTSSKKSNKKREDSTLEASTNSSELLKDSTQSSEFNFKEKILEILMEKNSISHKKLQKKILKAYLSTTGESNCEEKVVKKLNRKLKKIPNVGIEDDRVVLQY